jgi:hypothetical protein
MGLFSFLKELKQAAAEGVAEAKEPARPSVRRPRRCQSKKFLPPV